VRLPPRGPLDGINDENEIKYNSRSGPQPTTVNGNIPAGIGKIVQSL